MTRGASVDALAFDAVLDRTAIGARPRHLTDAAGDLATRKTNAALMSGGKRTDDVYSRFEAMALTSFVESMLPASGDSIFGAGTSGRIWKSMMAEKIAAQMASVGGIGIADQMRAAAALRGDDAAGMDSAAARSLGSAAPVLGAADLSLDFGELAGEAS